MIIHRTIFRELLKNLSVVIFSLSVLLFMERFVRMTRIFMGRGADLLDIFKIFIYLQPSILLLSVPMALLIAVFLTYGRMSTDSETIVLKGSGMSFWGISRSSVFLSALLVAIMFAVSLYLLPVSMRLLKNTVNEAIIKKASMTFEEETFSDVFKGTVIYVKEIPAKDRFKGIFVYREMGDSLDEPVVIVAEDGAVTSVPEKGMIKLNMRNGKIHTYKKESSSEMSFSEYDFILTTGIDSITKVKPDEIKTLHLWEGRHENISWAIELNRRIALPFACIIFGILGPALSSKVGKIGRLGGFSMSIAILIFYYMLLILGEGLAESGEISPYIGGWAANILFGIMTLFFSHVAYKDKPLKRI